MLRRILALIGALYTARPYLFIFAFLGYVAVIFLAVAATVVPIPFAATWIPVLLVAPVIYLVTLYVTLSQAARIFTNWYNTPARQAYNVIVAHIFKGNYPKVKAAKGKIDLEAKTDEERQAVRTMMTAGIPVLLTLDADTAVLTEKNGRPHRVVVQPGAHTLEPFEDIRYAIDRRAHAGIKSGIQAMTRDGITVTLDVAVAYQIRRQGTPSVENPYPVDRAALFRAVYRRSIAAGAHEPEQLDVIVPNMVAIPTRNVIAQYRLSQLYEPSHGHPQAEAIVPRTEVGKKIAGTMEAVADSLGLEILSVSIVNLDVPDEEVRKHIFEQWAREREHEIEARMSPEQARRKANEMRIMLETLEEVKEGEDLSAFVERVRELYYLVQDLTEFIESEEEQDVTARRSLASPWSRRGLTRRQDRFQKADDVIKYFQEVDAGLHDTDEEIEEDEDLARRFPGQATVL